MYSIVYLRTYVSPLPTCRRCPPRRRLCHPISGRPTLHERAIMPTSTHVYNLSRAERPFVGHKRHGRRRRITIFCKHIVKSLKVQGCAKIRQFFARLWPDLDIAQRKSLRFFIYFYSYRGFVRRYCKDMRGGVSDLSIRIAAY